MSYDLYVFDPKVAPHTPDAFEDWLDDVGEKQEYSLTSEASTESLQAFYADLIKQIRPLNGPDAAADDVDPAEVGDYSLFPALIEMSFTFSGSGSAVPLVAKLVETHRLGLYDPQGDELYVTSERTGKLAFIRRGKLP